MDGLSAEVSEKIRAAIRAKLVRIYRYFELYWECVIHFILNVITLKNCRKNSALMSTMSCRTTSWFWWPTKKLKSKWKTICHYFCIIMPMFSQIGFKIFWTNWNRLPQPVARKNQVIKNLKDDKSILSYTNTVAQNI